MFSKIVLIVAGISALLAGCNAFAPRPTLGDGGPGEFVVSGRLGVNRGADGFSSSFSWHHMKDAFDIELWGPLGQGRTRIEGREGQVTIRASDGTVHEERDTAATMERWLGLSVPVSALVHWLRGEPAPDAAIEAEAFEAGDRTRLAQLGWQLEFGRYSAVSGIRVPARIVAQKDLVKVTLLPKDWSFAVPSR